MRRGAGARVVIQGNFFPLPREVAVLCQRPCETPSCKCRIVDRPIKSLVRPRTRLRRTVSRLRRSKKLDRRRGRGRARESESLEGTIGNAPCRKCLGSASFLSLSSFFPPSFPAEVLLAQRRKVGSWVATIIIIARGSFERSIDDLGFAGEIFAISFIPCWNAALSPGWAGDVVRRRKRNQRRAYKQFCI